MTPEIIQKYNRPVPRYTSYPPANHFAPFTEADYQAAVRTSNTAADNNVSFYLHIPFCRHLCHYCGCNSYAMPRQSVVQAYVDALHREIDLVAHHIDRSRRLSQIHYGGGSPTSLPPSVLRELNDHLLSLVPAIEAPEIAIECHPGYLTADDWQQLAQCGFTRYSLGLQDLRPDVLGAVNRRPSLVPVGQVVELLRATGATVNFDFIYGLPLQTADSFSETIRQAIALRPDRLVTFSYAHLPQLFPRQQALARFPLPADAEKQRMFESARKLLLEAGYQPIGLDHYVLPADELSTAFAAGQLHRNFQGYCTRRTTAQVYAFGVTGISQLDDAYAQNGRNIQQYIDTVLGGHLYTERGYRLTAGQKLVRQVIETLMCNYALSWTALAERLNVSPEQLREVCCYDEARMQQLAADGLIGLTTDGLHMTLQGRPFVRCVAAALDPLMLNNQKNYSKPI